MVLTAVANEHDRAILDQGLTAYNRTVSPDFAALSTPEGSQRPLDVYVRGDQGQILGGLAGTTYWGWLTIGLLWLDERIRGQSYGRTVLEEAEREARRRGCTRSWVTTYSFQARGFYEQMGYRVVGRLDDFPPGGARYTLRKELALTDAAPLPAGTTAPPAS
jgi:GNAT superfamily N-acetyltransferase